MKYVKRQLLWILIRIRRASMFLGLPDPDPSFILSASGSDPSINKQRSKKTLDFYYFVTSFWLFIYENWCKMYLQKVINNKLYHLVSHWRKNRIRICKPVVRIRGSGSILKCHGSTTLENGGMDPGFSSTQISFLNGWNPPEDCNKECAGWGYI